MSFREDLKGEKDEKFEIEILEKSAQSEVGR